MMPVKADPSICSSINDIAGYSAGVWLSSQAKIGFQSSWADAVK